MSGSPRPSGTGFVNSDKQTSGAKVEHDGERTDPSPKLSNKYNFSGITHADVLKHISGDQNEIRSIYEVTKEDKTTAPLDADYISTERGTYTSYGDEGTTASVNAYGVIMQITRFLGIGRSGFFSVDLPWVREPCFIQSRAQDLAELYGSMGGITFTMDVDGINDDAYPHELKDVYSRPMKLEFTHDRWPRFTARPSNNFRHFSMEVQHFASNRTIFERYFYETTQKTPLLLLAKKTNLAISPNLRIRELEFTDWNYSFNEEAFVESGSYSHFLGPHGRSVIVTHHGTIPSGEKDGGTIRVTVGVVIALCVNGKVRELEPFVDDRFSANPGTRYRVKFSDDEEGFWVEESKPLEVTTAFRLLLLSDDISWKDLLVTESDFFSMDNAFKTNGFRKLPFSSEPHIDFTTRRNLEQILSVCSIPVSMKPVSREDKEIATPPDLKEKNSGQEGNTTKTVYGTALTCGDISGHRLVTSASFFAFQFLLSVFGYLEKFQNDSNGHPNFCWCSRKDRAACAKFARALRNRIITTCRAHITWLEHSHASEGYFGADYWATGRPITSWERESREMSSLQSLTDTSFQIIKLADFSLAFKSEQAETDVKEVLRRFVRPWIERLDKLNSRNFFAFPRPSSIEFMENKVFRLEDHIWIWRALEAIEKIDLGEELKKKMSNEKVKRNLAQRKHPENSLQRDYSSAEFQRHVLKRFTTENSASRQRMLAVSRSASYNRFMFHARDTALFYDRNAPFFNKSNALWKATIDTQKFHEENRDSSWDSPLRYALALIMGTKGFQINTKKAEDMFDMAKKVLDQISSDNGLFPGQINSETKEPKLFDPGLRDQYWHVSFEVPYLMFKSGANTKVSQNFQKLSLKRVNSETDLLMLQSDPANQRRAQFNQTQATSSLTQEPGGNSRNLEMKKLIPFNRFIDQRNIVDVSEEWLYNEPDFLDFDPDMDKLIAAIERSERTNSEAYIYEELIELNLEALAPRGTSLKDFRSGDEWTGSSRSIVRDVQDLTNSKKAPEFKYQYLNWGRRDKCLTNKSLYET